MLTLKGCFLCVALAPLLAAAASLRPKICDRVQIAADGTPTHSEMLFELGLIDQEGHLQEKAQKHFPRDESITYLRSSVTGLTVETVTLHDDKGNPTLLRVRSISRATVPFLLRESLPLYFKVNPDTTLTEIPTSTRIYNSQVGDTLVLSDTILPPISLTSLPGRQVHPETVPVALLAGDPRAIHVSQNQIVMLVRPKEGPDKKANYDKIYTYGMGPCAGVFIEGKDFAVVTHLLSTTTSPPDVVLKMILDKIDAEGLSREGMKVRVIGGEEKSEDLATGFVRAVKANGLTLVETDILGRLEKDFSRNGRALGYRFTDDPIPVPFEIK